MNGVLRYVTQEQKITDEHGVRYLTGVNCTADLAFQSFMATKNLYGQAKGVFFYQYVQSFSPEEQVTPLEAHQIALELTERFFPGYEVLVATHVDAAHIHSHFVVNSVGPDTGKKLHFTPRTLEKMRQLSDQICQEHGLTVLKPYRQKAQVKGLRPGEYRSALQGKSWKFRLIAEIEAAMERTGSREDFIREMWRRGFATLSLKNGVDVKTLSSTLGHYSAGFTLSTYTHATAEMKREAAETIGDVISGAM